MEVEGQDRRGGEPKKRVVVVMGSTGVGKSQLAVDLALALQSQGRGAEIISADSMQIYRGFPVATAKEEEKAGVVHHLLDVAAPTDITFNVIQFCRLAVAAIDDIHRRGNLPIVVGGTHYYLEALLWDNVLLHDLDAPLLPKHHHQPTNREEGEQDDVHQREEGDGEATKTRTKAKEGEKEEDEEGGGRREDGGDEELYRRLTEVDPLTASWLHPHNLRKIRRALEVFDTTGKLYSEMLREQASPTPRYDALLFWIDCDRSVLNTRLDKRVDKMTQAGLLDEVAELRRIFKSEGLPMDYTKGILQAIGYKEFAPYFAAVEAEKADDGGRQRDAALKACVSALKKRTRKYAKVQTGWIQRHFRPRATIHRLDSTRAEEKRWNDEVRLPAVHVLDQWAKGAEADKTENGEGNQDLLRYVRVLQPPSAASSSSLSAIAKRATSERRRDGGGDGSDDESEKKRNKTGEGEEEEEDREKTLAARWRRFVCEDCDGKVLQGETQWRAHLKSRGHHHHRKRRRQQQMMMGGD